MREMTPKEQLTFYLTMTSLCLKNVKRHLGISAPEKEHIQTPLTWQIHLGWNHQ